MPLLPQPLCSPAPLLPQPLCSPSPSTLTFPSATPFSSASASRPLIFPHPSHPAYPVCRITYLKLKPLATYFPSAFISMASSSRNDTPRFFMLSRNESKSGKAHPGPHRSIRDI